MIYTAVYKISVISVIVVLLMLHVQFTSVKAFVCIQPRIVRLASRAVDFATSRKALWWSPSPIFENVLVHDISIDIGVVTSEYIRAA